MRTWLGPPAAGVLAAGALGAFLGWSAREVPVSCGPRLARTPVCDEVAP